MTEYKTDEFIIPTEFFELRIIECETLYKETRNPVHVWTAINYCPYANQRIPVWIQDYLSETSANILECKRNADFSKALGITGRDIQNLDTINNRSMVSLYVHFKIKKGLTRGAAINSAMKHFGMGEKNIERALADCNLRSTKVI